MEPKQCRTCSSFETSSNSMVSIFERGIHELLKDLVQIEIHVADAYICNFCKELLFTFKNFKIRCQQSAEYFASIEQQKFESTETHFVNANIVTDNEEEETGVEEVLDEEEGTQWVMEYNDNASFRDSATSDKHQVFIEESVSYDLIEESDGEGEGDTPTKKLRVSYKKSPDPDSAENIKTFYCEECNIGFTNRTNYRRHHQQIHIEGLVECDLCAKTFTGKRNLAQHMEIQHMVELEKNRRTFKCLECSEEVVGTRRFTRHKMKHNTRTCPICGIIIKATSYRNHLVSHDPQRPLHRCEPCGISFRSMQTFKLHQMWHEGKTFTCGICKKNFKGPYHLKKHKEAIHRGALQCSSCDLVFLTEKRLATHEKQVHIELDRTRPVEEFPFACDECGKRFKKLQYVLKHKLIHTKYEEEMRFTCLDCGKKCNSETHLATHKFTHVADFETKRDSDNHFIDTDNNSADDSEMIENVIEEIEVSANEEQMEEDPVVEIEEVPETEEEITIKADISVENANEQMNRTDETVIQVIKVSSQSKPKFKKPTIIMK